MRTTKLIILLFLLRRKTMSLSRAKIISRRWTNSTRSSLFRSYINCGFLLMKARFFSPLIDAIFHPAENIKPKLHHTRLEMHALIAQLTLNLERAHRSWKYQSWSLKISINLNTRKNIINLNIKYTTLLPLSKSHHRSRTALLIISNITTIHHPLANILYLFLLL